MNSLSKMNFLGFLDIWCLGRFRQGKAKAEYWSAGIGEEVGQFSWGISFVCLFVCLSFPDSNSISFRYQVFSLAPPLTRQLFYREMDPHLDSGPQFLPLSLPPLEKCLCPVGANHWFLSLSVSQSFNHLHHFFSVLKSDCL